MLSSVDETVPSEIDFSEDFRIALDSTTQPVYIIDPETYTVLYYNEVLFQYIGTKPLGLPCYKAILNQDAPCSNCVAQRLHRDGINETMEFYHPSGVWMLVRVSPFIWKGRKLYKLICFDITDRKSLEAEVRLKNKEYDAIVQQSLTGIMRYDILNDTATLNVNSRLERVEEYTIENSLDVLFGSGLIPPDSLPTAHAILDDIRNSRVSKGYDLKLSPDQDCIRWCHVNYTLIKDEHDEPYRAVIFFYDNTEQHEQELAYQNWRHRLNVLMDDKTVYLGVNLSKDIVEIETRTTDTTRYMGARPYSDIVNTAGEHSIFYQDRPRFKTFFNRDRLLGQYFDGISECSLEYRAVEGDNIEWYRADVQMICDPTTGHVKAAIVLNNIDADIKEHERLQNKAKLDPLTKIYNRAEAESQIKKVLENNSGERCCFLIIDLDDLRMINSDLGHPEGDKALKAISDCMKYKFKKDDIIGRIGGDEFVVLLRNLPEEQQVHSAISNFISCMNNIQIGSANDRAIRVSIGGAIGIAGTDDFVTLYKKADLALYYAKSTGKNSFKLYAPELEQRDFTYRPCSTATLNGTEPTNPSEFKRLINALSLYCPLIVSVNLTQNKYYMMEYTDFLTQKAHDGGTFDQLIEESADTFHPEDRESFLKCFKRENLLRAYEEGVQIVRHKGRQLGDDGVYRISLTTAVLSKDEATGDIHEISFTHVEPC